MKTMHYVRTLYWQEILVNSCHEKNKINIHVQSIEFTGLGSIRFIDKVFYHSGLKEEEVLLDCNINIVVIWKGKQQRKTNVGIL